MNPQKHISEIESVMKKHALADLHQRKKIQKYVGTKLNVHGLSAPLQKKLAKAGFSFHSHDRLNNFFLYHEIFLQSPSHEGKNMAFLFLEQNIKHIPSEIRLKKLPEWVTVIDNWAHSDYLSKFISRLIEDELTEKQMMKHVFKWNKSKNPWERRQSLVALFYYARTKKKHVSFEDSIRLISPLLNDSEYFVQKAVGWTLRECYNVYPKQTYQYVLSQSANISSIAFSATCEKMNMKEKETIKLLRKKHV